MLSRWQNHIVDEEGNVIPSVEVEIREAGAEIPATIYSDAEGTEKSNPFAATAGGLAEFWAAGGLYDIYVGTNLVWHDVQIGSSQRSDLADPAEVAAGTAADDQIPTVAGLNLVIAAMEELIGACITLETVTAVGDVLVGVDDGEGGATAGVLAAGASGQVLTIVGGVPAWADPIVETVIAAVGDIVIGVTDGGEGATPQALTIGTEGQVLTAGSEGLPEWATLPSIDLADDITPQLGGDLDVNGHKIVSADNGDVDIEPNGTGLVNLQKDATGKSMTFAGFVSAGMRRVEKAATGALAILDILGTILTNYGQTAENIQTLPDTADVVAALGVGVEVGFVVRVETEGAGAFGLKPGADDKHYFDGGGGVVVLDNGAEVVFEVPNIGDTLVVTMIRTGESSFDWLTACVRGTAGE